LDKQVKTNLQNSFIKWSGENVTDFSSLPLSGSYRQYFRITSKNKSAIGVYNPDKKENIAFLSFTKHFLKKGLHVPELYSDNIDSNIYLLEDLGDISLYRYLSDTRKNGKFPEEILELYKKTLTELIQFQFEGGKGINYGLCYPRAKFDKQSMIWDLNYFKHYFLKLAKIPFDEQKLEDDFQNFSEYLLKADRNYFLYRDFQSRNIMLYNNDLYFIDYQGGRQGALQYDPASLIFEAKTDIPPKYRQKLISYYLSVLENVIPGKKKEFLKYYYGYVLIRIMQAMGAFGFRGFYEKKPLFLQSIPNSLKNLEWLLGEIEFNNIIPHLYSILKQMVISKNLLEINGSIGRLKVYINSFSFNHGIPYDEAGNGGGYVFDCRAVPNPGKYKQYQEITGLDKPVHDFFRKEKEMHEFLENIYSLVDRSVLSYIERNYESLTVNFGCTGGQHRSVYSAEKLVEHLIEKFDIEITIRHRELE